MAIQFVVPGRPVPKARPRLGMRGRRVYIYTPEETVAYEDIVRFVASSRCRAPAEGPLEVTVRAFFKPKGRAPDLDNVIKSLLDGMNGIVFRDDSQVVRIHAYLLRDKDERAEVEVCQAEEAAG